MHSLKAAYTDRSDSHQTMRCSCGYICGAQSWEVVGRAMDSHIRAQATRQMYRSNDNCTAPDRRFDAFMAMAQGEEE